MTRDLLDTQFQARLDAAQREWFSRSERAVAGGTTEDLLRVYTEASRSLGPAPLGGDDDAASPLRSWRLEDAGRLLLLLARHRHLNDAERFSIDALACCEQGDAREQQSWMRGVAWLPDAARYLPVVIDTCRTNILPLFQSVACDNPYPARYFPDANFNQMVLKALFNGVPLARIEGLAARANADLARMASDYAAERRAAGRSVPADIDLALSAAAQKD